MGFLSNLSGKETVKKFERFGYRLHHQTGSHIILYHNSKPTEEANRAKIEEILSKKSN